MDGADTSFGIVLLTLGILATAVVAVAYTSVATTIISEMNTPQVIPKYEFASDPTLQYFCREEIWANQTTQTTVTIDYHRGIFTGVAPIYNVCYYRDGHTTITKVGEHAGRIEANDRMFRKVVE